MNKLKISRNALNLNFLRSALRKNFFPSGEGLSVCDRDENRIVAFWNARKGPFFGLASLNDRLKAERVELEVYEILEVEQMASCKKLRDLSAEDIVSKAKDLMINDSVTIA